MAITMNLRDLINPQYSAVTGRKSNTPYQAYLTAMGPSVRSAAQQTKVDELKEKELLQGKDQFGLTQALEREKMDAAAKAARTSNIIQGTGLAMTGAYLADKAGLISLPKVGEWVKNKIWPTEAVAPLVEGVATQAASDASAFATGYGSEIGGELAAEQAASNAAAYEAGYGSEIGSTAASTIAAAEQTASNSAAFATGYGSEIGATEAATTVAAPAAAEASVFTNSLPTAAAAYLGSKAGDMIADTAGEALDVGGESERGFVGRVGGGAAAGAAMGAFGGPLAPVSVPVGAAIGAAVGLIDYGFNEGKGVVQDVVDTGKQVVEEAGDTARDVYNNTLGQITGGTWICTEIERRFGMRSPDTELLSVLRRYAIRNHRPESAKYFKNGELLVAAINQDDKQSPTIRYDQLNDLLVHRCCQLVDNDKIEEAYQHYKEITEDLCREYDVDLTIKETGGNNG